MPEPADHEQIPETQSPPSLPEFSFGDLQKRNRIGAGGDADVYRASIDYNSNGYTVALKEPRFEGTIQKQGFEKFQTEAKTWSSLSNHDNIVTVYAWGSEPLPWLGLEFMNGGTLQSRIGTLDMMEALWLSGRIAEGIRYGHRHGIAHLDIKPTNILLRNTPSDKWDYPKVSDWGLAKVLLEHSNSVEGISPTYAAPEQFDPDTFGDPDDFTDIYQLGTVVYALLAGEPPFTGSSTTVMRSVLEDKPDPPSSVNPNLSDAVDKIIFKALAKRKDERYESVVVFRQKLDRLFQKLTDPHGGATDTGAGRSNSGGGTQGDKGTDSDNDRVGDKDDSQAYERIKPHKAEPGQKIRYMVKTVYQDTTSAPYEGTVTVSEVIKPSDGKDDRIILYFEYGKDEYGVSTRRAVYDHKSDKNPKYQMARMSDGEIDHWRKFGTEGGLDLFSVEG